jgi:hypothetical protein
MFRKEVRELIWAFLFISLGGLLLHLRIHPPQESLFNWVAAGFAGVNTVLLPFLFNKPATAPWAYLFVWGTVITGTAAMAYHSIVTWKLAVTFQTVIMHSTLPDILILIAKVPIAHKILCAYRREDVASKRGEGAE